MGTKDDWRRVRQQRSKPPGLADRDEERRRVFQAALTQAEELWDAAATAGPASRPLPLFYCLSQACRAVCAAWTAEEQWRPRSHGLKRRESNDPSPEMRVFDYAAQVNHPDQGAYGMVAAATESVTVTGHASAAELWASLPGFPTPREYIGDRPRCLLVELARAPGSTNVGYGLFGLGSRTHIAFQFTAPPLEELVANYPTLRGIVEDGTRRSILGFDEPLFRIEHEDGTARDPIEVGTLVPGAESSFGNRVVRPKVGEEAVGPPSEFLTLYTLLFCLSELARYHPDTWVLALDPDESRAAVTLERGLDVALERAPAVISDALQGPLPRLLAAEIRRMSEEAAAASEVAAPDDPAE